MKVITETVLFKWSRRLIFSGLRGREASKELLILEQLVVFEDVEDPVDMNDVARDETADHGEGQSDAQDGQLDHGLFPGRPAGAGLDVRQEALEGGQLSSVLRGHVGHQHVESRAVHLLRGDEDDDDAVQRRYLSWNIAVKF